MFLESLYQNFSCHLINSFDENEIYNFVQSIDLVKTKNAKLMMGLDAEFYSGHVAVLQLSFYSDKSLTHGEVYIIRFYDENGQYHSDISQILTNIFMDKDIIKIGVNIGNDIAHIMKSFYLHNPNNNVICNELIKSSFDLQKYHMKNNKESNSRGLAYLSEYYCHLDISLVKTKKITISNWSNYNLSQEQINYAFTDTLMCIEIGKIIDAVKLHGTNSNNYIKLPKIRQRETCNETDDKKLCCLIFSPDKFISDIYKKYNYNFLRFLTGYDSIVINNGIMYNNIISQIKIRDKDGNIKIKNSGFIAKYQCLKLIEHKKIIIIDGTENNPVKVLYTKIINENDFNIDQTLEVYFPYDFTHHIRPNICFSCCSKNTLVAFNIIPRGISLFCQKYCPNIENKFNMNTHIYTVPICSECYCTVLDTYIDHWKTNYNKYYQVLQTAGEVKKRNEFSSFAALGIIIKAKTSQSTIDLDMIDSIKHALSANDLDYDKVYNMTTNEIIQLQKNFLPVREKKCQAHFSAAHHWQKTHETKKNIIEKLESVSNIIYSDDQLENMIMSFRNLFITKILHESLVFRQ
jgi:3'-5' exonuclease